MHALDALVGPVGVLVGRADEEDVGARRVRAVALDVGLRRDDVAARLGHLRAVARDHALGEEPGERLLHVEVAEVGQRLREEARVHQVQDRVLDAADVLVDRHPAVDDPGVPGRRVVVRRRSSAGSTRRSRRTCPSCPSRGAPAHRTTGTRRAPSPPRRRAATGRAARSPGRRGARPAGPPRAPARSRSAGSGSSGSGSPSSAVARAASRAGGSSRSRDPSPRGPATARCARAHRGCSGRRSQDASGRSARRRGTGRSPPAGSETTRLIGRPNALAKAKSRSSWPGTAMIAPVPYSMST